MKESDLYPALKLFLQSQNYQVKGEIGHCDVFAIRGDEPPLVVELKLSLNLTVLLQAVDRLSLTPNVYIGVPKQCSALKSKHKKIIKLLRMLGIGLMSIDSSIKASSVSVLLDPSEYKPRISKQRSSRLLGEFEKRVGDPNMGGGQTKKGIVTAYRQRALKIARFLDEQGASKSTVVMLQTAEAKARDIMYRDVYGWFDNISRGVYALSPRGKREIHLWLEDKST